MKPCLNVSYVLRCCFKGVETTAIRRSSCDRETVPSSRTSDSKRTATEAGESACSVARSRPTHLSKSFSHDVPLSPRSVIRCNRELGSKQTHRASDALHEPVSRIFGALLNRASDNDNVK